MSERKASYLTVLDTHLLNNACLPMVIGRAVLRQPVHR